MRVSPHTAQAALRLPISSPAIFAHSLLELSFLEVILEIRIIWVCISSDLHMSFDESVRGKSYCENSVLFRFVVLMREEDPILPSHSGKILVFDP